MAIKAKEKKLTSKLEEKLSIPFPLSVVYRYVYSFFICLGTTILLHWFMYYLLDRYTYGSYGIFTIVHKTFDIHSSYPDVRFLYYIPEIVNSYVLPSIVFIILGAVMILIKKAVWKVYIKKAAVKK